jgi:hypothetical protein
MSDAEGFAEATILADSLIKLAYLLRNLQGVSGVHISIANNPVAPFFAYARL